MKDKPVDLIKGTNKTQNRSKIALSKDIGKGYGIKFLVLPHKKVQTSSVLKPILNHFLFV